MCGNGICYPGISFRICVYGNFAKAERQETWGI